MPPGDIHAVVGHLFGLTIDSDTLVHTLKVLPEQIVGHSYLLVKTLDDFDSIGVNLLDRADSDLGLLEVLHKFAAGSLGPVELLTEVVLGDEILILLKPKTHI